MHIYAHRGLWVKYPENTKPAFVAALQKGYSIETDMRRTRDNDIVIIHDSNTKRATGMDMSIIGSTVEQLKELNFGNSHSGPARILTLRELLDLLVEHPGKQVLALQMKSFEDGTENIIAGIINKFDKDHPKAKVFERVFVFDVTKEVAPGFKKESPKLRLSYSLGEDRHFPDKRYPTIYTKQQLEHEGTCDIIWGDEWEGGLYSRELIEHYKKQRKLFIAISPELHSSTDPKHPYAGKVAELRQMWQNLIHWGADGICTDYTEELSEMIGE